MMLHRIVLLKSFSSVQAVFLKSVTMLFLLTGLFPLKAGAIDSLKNIVVTVTFSAPPSSFTVTKVPLRYDKDFAYSFQIDDGGKDIYTHGYPFFEGGTISGTSYPGLKYTDGCGNDLYFKMSTSLFSFSTYGGGETDMHDPNSAYAPLNVTWPEVNELYQHGWGVSNHGLTSSSTGNMPYDIARNHSYVKLKTQSAVTGGIDMGIFVNPNGSEAYSPYAFAQNYLVCYRVGYTLGDPSLNVNATWDHNQIKMGRNGVGNNVNLPALVDAMAAASTGSARHWGVHFTHAITNGGYGYDFATFQTALNYVANTYGKNGLDNIWMATEEEILDYLLIKDAITIQTQLTGNILKITFSGTIPSSYKYYIHSLKVAADQPIASVTATGISGMTHNGAGTNNALINLNWNGHYTIPPEVNAETWVSKTETTHDQNDANVAMDYVLMVPAGATQQAFRLRLCTVTGITLPASFCNMRNAPINTIPNINGCPGSQILVPLLVNGFTNITSATLRLEYDTTLVRFVSGSAAKPLVLPGMQITDTAVGGSSPRHKILIRWSNATPKSLSASDTLARFFFTDLSGNAAIAFNTTSGSGGDCEFLDENGNVMIDFPVSTYYINGGIQNKGLPAPGQVTGPVSVCPGSTGHIYAVPAVTGATGYLWVYPSGFSPVSGGTTNAVTLYATSEAQSGNITVKAVNTCSTNPFAPALAVTVAPKPLPSLSGADTVCAVTGGMVYSTDPGMTNYAWTVTAGGTITAGYGTNSIQVTWLPAGTQSVSVIYTGTGGCTAPVPTVKHVTVNARPLPTITGPATGCFDGQATYSTETGKSGYNWDIPSGAQVISGGGNTPSVTLKWTGTGLKTIGVNYYNAAGCNALLPSTTTVNVYPLPVPGITGAGSVCQGSTGIIYSTEPGMTGYLWTLSSGGIITSGAGTNLITVTWTSTGPQNVSVIYTIPAGCTAPVAGIKNVTVKPLPVPSLSGPATVCANTGMPVYSTDPGMMAYQWTISPGGLIAGSATTNAVQVLWNSAGQGWIAANYTAPNGCSASAPVQLGVTVNPLPVPSVAGPASACVGTLMTYSTDPGMTGYQWAVSPGGTIVTGTATHTVQVQWATAGNGWVSVNYTNTTGCTGASASVFPVTVFNPPTPSITGVSTVCAGASNIFYSTENGMSNYQWTVSAGGTILSGTGTSLISVGWTGAGPQTVGVSYTNGNGCAPLSPTIKNVIVIAPPTPTITGFDSICLNSTAWYITEPGMNAYLWNISSGGIIISGAASNIIQVQWTTTGTKTLTVSYTTPDGCIPLSPGIKSVTVYQLLPSLAGPATVCTNTGNVIYTTEPGMMNYTWTVSAGGNIVSGQGTNVATVNWSVAGIQMVTVNYSNAVGCSAPLPSSLQVTVNSPPVPAVSGPTSLCVNSGIHTYSTEAGMSGYQWTVSAGGLITGGQGTASILVNWIVPGSQTVGVSYTGLNGCAAAAPGSLNVTVNPFPGAAGVVSGPAMVCKPANGLAYSVVPVAGASGYLWNLPPGCQIVQGNNTPNITVNYSAGAQSGDIAAAAINTCGVGAFSPPLAVQVHPYPATPVISSYSADTLISTAEAGNQWYFEGAAIPGATDQKHHFTHSGRYFVIVTLNQCQSDTSNVLNAVVTGVSGCQKPLFRIYPNPVSERVTLSGLDLLQPGDLSVIVSDLTGKSTTLLSEERISGTFSRELEVDHLSPGCYILRIHFRDGIYLLKLVVAR